MRIYEDEIRSRRKDDGIPLGSVWRTETGAYVRVVHTDGNHIYVRNANGKGHTWSVLPAWFTTPVEDGGMERLR